MSELTQRVVDIVRGTAGKLSDSDQRSALGMARTWLEKREPIKRQVNLAGFKNRDDLAEALVEALEGREHEESLEALAAARAWVNAPYQADPELLAMRRRRVIEGLVGSEKKNGKQAAK